MSCSRCGASDAQNDLYIIDTSIDITRTNFDRFSKDVEYRLCDKCMADFNRLLNIKAPTHHCAMCENNNTIFYGVTFRKGYDSDKAYEDFINRVPIEEIRRKIDLDFELCLECYEKVADWVYKGGEVQKFSDSMWEDAK